MPLSRQKLRDRVDRWSRSKWMLPGMTLASVLESTIVPIPLEAVLIPAMQKARRMLWWLASAAMLGCLIGASLGYLVGLGLMESVGRPFVEYLEQGDALASAEQAMRDNGFWFVMTISLAPVPFQIAMLAAGATGYSFLGFIAATLISRGVRYYGLALLVYLFGDRAERLFREHKVAATLILLAIVGLAWGVSRLI